MAEAQIRIPPSEAHIVATHVFERGNVLATITTYYELPSESSVTQGNIGAIADAIYNHLKLDVAACLPASVSYTRVVAKLMGSVLDLSSTSTGAATVGTAGAVDPLPEGDCISIQRLSGKKKPRNRGRVYMPFVPETFVLDSALTPTGLGAYLAAATMMSQFIGAVEENETPLLLPALINWREGLLELVSQCRVQPEVKHIKRRRAPKRSFAVIAPAS